MRVPLESATLASATYHPAQRRLEIQFRSGKRYLYFQVPAATYQQLLSAHSKGSFFNQHIRNRFPYQHLRASSTPVVLPNSPIAK